MPTVVTPPAAVPLVPETALPAAFPAPCTDPAACGLVPPTPAATVPATPVTAEETDEPALETVCAAVLAAPVTADPGIVQELPVQPPEELAAAVRTGAEGPPVADVDPCAEPPVALPVRVPAEFPRARETLRRTAATVLAVGPASAAVSRTA